MRSPLSQWGEGSSMNSPAWETTGGTSEERYRGAGFAPNEVGQINGLARNTTLTLRPG